MLFTGTLTLGCKSYLDSQARSCYCPVGKADKAYEKSDKTYDKSDKAYEKSDKYYDKGYKDKGKDKNNGKYGWKQDL